MRVWAAEHEGELSRGWDVAPPIFLARGEGEGHGGGAQLGCVVCRLKGLRGAKLREWEVGSVGCGGEGVAGEGGMGGEGRAGRGGEEGASCLRSQVLTLPRRVCSREQHHRKISYM